MKRDMDLIRELLLRLEAIDLPVGEMDVISAEDERIEVGDRTPDEIGHHLGWIVEAKLVQGEMLLNHNAITFERLSWQGCDFVEAVRDPEVWRRTKEGAAKVGGWSFGLLKDIATAYIKSEAKSRLGFDL